MLANALTIDDLKRMARRRVPKMFFDYADSGAWTEQTYHANESDFAKILLRQRILVDMTDRNLATEMVGEPVSMPLAALRKHVAIFAGSGSGKTVLIGDPGRSYFPREMQSPPPSATGSQFFQDDLSDDEWLYLVGQMEARKLQDDPNMK